VKVENFDCKVLNANSRYIECELQSGDIATKTNYVGNSGFKLEILDLNN